MGDRVNVPKANPDRVKEKVHRRCKNCGDVVKTQGATRATTRLNGEFPAMLRVYTEIDVKQELIELARTERVTLSAVVRRILRDWLSER